MTILGIETSCDETAVAVLKVKNGKFNLLSNIVSSQVKIHAKYGGIVPEVAARMQMEMIIPVIKEALVGAGFKPARTGHRPVPTNNIDYIAVTQGPGLVTSLVIGVETAKTLSYILNKPLIPVNHLVAHLLVNCINNKIKYPAVGLIVSGGHTMLVLMKNPSRGKYEIIGETQDDAVGEAFDKVAKILNLGYPGGPIISKLAINGDKNKFKLPRPMIQQQNFNFSFSGLKTAVLYLTQDKKFKKTKQNINDLCASFQQACIDVLVSKTLRAIKKYKPKSFLLGGGVAANSELRKQLKEKINTKFPEVRIFIPELKFTGDNAAMIAVAGYFQATKNTKTLKHKNRLDLKADPNLNL
ncbi:tRNA (adenosine(37)-N6)-threonylcarbamoyltransferase complex transferase subunit TsaD [Candidatus Parcubacteria bacterium]|nr:tRNA (adenosine(37)-N6)-threonylcarbamoyltransferase complex transferase subunit TsaD [Candidatus Parcubacteria bacterium]